MSGQGTPSPSEEPAPKQTVPGKALPEKTPDGHHIIVKGRRWRATDPLLDEEVAATLRHHLGTARSAIGRLRDEQQKAPWRRRVQLAKEGLGERGTPWWELDDEARHRRADQALSQLDALVPGDCVSGE